MSIIKELLTEKLRPTTFDQIILPQRIKQMFPSGEITQNILLSGTQGMGKTSLAKILAKDYPTLYLNISSERGIDVVRERITEFASTKSFMSNSEKPWKIVILDEMDGGTDLLFKALRATMEKFSFNTRFIGTCNFLSKIPEPIQSRFSVIKFDPIDKKEEKELKNYYITRVKKVSEKLKLNWESEKLIETFVDKNFPDLRKIFSIIQDLKNSNMEVISEEHLIKTQYQFNDIYDLILGDIDPVSNYKKIMEYQGRSDDIFSALSKDFIEFVFENHKEYEMKVPELLYNIAEWDYKRKFLIDENLALLACIFQCQNIIQDN